MPLCCCRDGRSSGGEEAGAEAEAVALHVEEGVQQMPWYHGRLPRELAEPLLCADGDFLVRESSVRDSPRLTLSVRWGDQVKHIILQRSAEGWSCRPGDLHGSVQQLVRHHQRSGQPLLEGWPGRLVRAVQNVTWDLTSQEVELVKKIGEGCFGEVFLGVLRSSGEQVAVKTCRKDLPDEHRRAIIEEGRLLRRYRHRHVVGFIGMCLHRNTVMVVMEFVPGGSLRDYLREHRLTLSTEQLTAMCRDAAEGMAYLESIKCVHRDLAARNCLLGENNLVKISDFGMSREVEDYYMTHNLRQVPVKWTAPEALHMGFRMQPPAGTPAALAGLMSRCWQAERRRRPHFSAILRAIQDHQARGAHQ